MKLKTLQNKLFSLGDKNNYSAYFSIFRVFVCLLLLKQIFQLWPYSSLLFSGNSFYVAPSEVTALIPVNIAFLREHFIPFYGIYVSVIILYLFGIGKNFTALLIFLVYDMIERLCPMILNGGDNLLKFLLIYMIFADSYDYLSLNPKKKNTSDTLFYNNFFSNIAGICICCHLCLVYFITGIHKIHSDVWFHGIATYYTMQLERFQGTSINLTIAHNPILVTITSYFTVLVEISYPMLIWFKETRRPVMIGAIMLHIGIYIFMMIYDFQLIFIAVQGFFISNEFWKDHLKKIHLRAIRYFNFCESKVIALKNHH